MRKHIEIQKNIAIIAASQALDNAGKAMDVLTAALEKTRASLEKLTQASEANRAFEVLPEDEFKEEYPQYSDYADGDMDEVLLEAIAQARETLKTTIDPAQIKTLEIKGPK